MATEPEENNRPLPQAIIDAVPQQQQAPRVAPQPQQQVFDIDGPGDTPQSPAPFSLPEDDFNIVNPVTQFRDHVFFQEASRGSVANLDNYINAGMTQELIPTTTGVYTETIREQVLEDPISQEEQDARLIEMMEDLGKIPGLERFMPASMVEAIKVQAPGARHFAIDRMSRTMIAGNMINEKVGEDAGWLNLAVDIGEILVDPLDIVHQSTYKRLVGEYEEILQPGVPLEVFEREFGRILDEASDAGFFSENNRFMLGGFLGSLGAGVHSREQEFADFFGWADITLTGVGEAIATTRRVASAASNISRTPNPASLATARRTVGVHNRTVDAAVVDSALDPVAAVNTLNRESNASERLLGTALIDDPSVAAGRVPNHTQDSASTPSFERGGVYAQQDSENLHSFLNRSSILDELFSIRRDAGSQFEPGVVEELAGRIVEDREAHFRATGQRRVMDVDFVSDDFDNLFYRERIGKADGTYFKFRETAARHAEEGDIVQQVGVDQWVVIRDVNVADDLEALKQIEGLSSETLAFQLRYTTNDEALKTGFWARFGSILAQSDPRLIGVAARGESAGMRAMNAIASQYKQAIAGVTGRQEHQVWQMFEQMQNSVRKSSYSVEEFQSEFFQLHGMEPTARQTNLYTIVQQRLDVEAFVRADEMFKHHVSNNVEILTLNDNISQPVRRVAPENVPDNGIWLVNEDGSGTLVTKSNLPPDVDVYISYGESNIPSNARYIADPYGSPRRVFHEDFMVRNAGGHRQYLLSRVQHFVKQRREVTYADGGKADVNPRTALATVTEDEALTAVSLLNNIVSEIRKLAIRGSGESIKVFNRRLLSAFNTSEVNSLIRTNNAWNPDIEDLSDLVKFSNDRDIDLSVLFGRVGEGEQVKDFAKTLDDEFAGLSTHGQTASLRIAQGGRGSTPLIGFGGSKVATRPVSQSIQSAHVSTLLGATEQAYRAKAINGLLLSAHDAKVLTNAGELKGLSLKQKLNRAVINTSSEAGKKLALEQKRLMFRLQKDNFLQRTWEKITVHMSTYLYGKGFKHKPNMFDKESTNPLTKLRGYAFDAYLGVFNPSQIFMQGIQAVNVASIGGTHGIKGVALYPAMRWAVAGGDANFTKYLGGLLQKVTGVDQEDFNNMVEMYKRSNRHFVDNNIADLTVHEDYTKAVSSSGLKRGVNAVREAGRVPFKEGDRIARISSFNTAYLEYTEKFGRIAGPTDQKAMNWIANRDQVLTQAMTTMSRQGYEQLPFMQFMSYQLRVNEALFAGTFDRTKAVLTGKEKLRLATTHLTLFGAGGFAVTSLGTDYVNAHYGYEVPETLGRFARKGLIDTLLSEITESETAVGARLGSGDGIFQFLRNFAENSAFEASLGASGQLFQRTLKAGYGIAKAAVRGDVRDVGVNLMDLARLTSTGNYTYNAAIAVKYGRYLGKQGQLISDNINYSDAVFLAFGMPLEEVDTAYRFIAQQKMDRMFFRNHGASISRTHNLINEAVRREDWDAVESYRSILSVQWNSLTPWEREEVKRFTRTSPESMIDRVFVEAFKRDAQMGDNL